MKLGVLQLIPKVKIEERCVHYASPQSHLNYQTLCGIGKMIMGHPTTDAVQCFRCKEIAEYVHKCSYVTEVE